MDNRFHFSNGSNFTDMNYLLLLNLSVLIMILKLRPLKEPEMERFKIFEVEPRSNCDVSFNF